MLEALTRPTPIHSAGADPREAQKGDTLQGGLRVERRLGSGGTALVLHVRREGRDFALKVPHDAGCGERLLSEAKTLRELRHEHIVALRDVVTLGGLPCLLLEFAGDRSLGDVLREQGTLPLELARRYGDDLLSAVQYLEEAGVTHRDIKPTNVGFTSLSKKQSHLLAPRLLAFVGRCREPSRRAPPSGAIRGSTCAARGTRRQTDTPPLPCSTTRSPAPVLRSRRATRPPTSSSRPSASTPPCAIG